MPRHIGGAFFNLGRTTEGGGVMAELILTDEEKQSETYLDLDNDSLGKAVKNFAITLGDVYGADSIWSTGCATLLIDMCIKTNATTLTHTIEGLTHAGEDRGDWKITVQKISPQPTRQSIGGSDG